MSGGQFPLNAKALGRRPTRDDLSAKSAQNWDRLHCEDPGHLAPEISESACWAVARFWESLIKVQNFPVKERTCWLSIRLLLPPRIPAVGSGDAARALPSRGIFKGDSSPP